MEFLYKIFDTSDFPQRWECGTWSQFHGWLHILSDLAVFGAYMAIPMVVIYFGLRRKDVQLPKLFWLFCAFIFACGFVHLIEATIFWTPIYRISAVAKFVTAIVSWATVVAIVRVAPVALTLPTLSSLNEQLEEKNRTLLATQAQLEDALNEAHRVRMLLDATINSTGSGVIVSDQNNEFILLNPAGQKLLGKLSELAPEEWNESVGLFKSEDGPLFVEHELPLFRANKGEATHQMELLMKNGVDENPIWITSTATQVINRDGEPLGAVAVFDDITTRRKLREGLRDLQLQTESKLAQSTLQLEELLNSIPEAIWREEKVNQQLRHVYYSPGIEKIAGRKPEELIEDKATWLSQIHIEDRPQINEALASILEGKREEAEVEYRITHAEGSTRWVRNRVRAQQVGDVLSVQGIMTDITNERDTNLALVRAERLASIGTLAAGIAHEINNPLGAMMLTVDSGKMRIKKGNSSTEQVELALDDIMRQIDRCSKIVSSVLKFANNETSERKIGSLLPVAEDSKNLILFKAKRKLIEVEIQSDDRVEPVVSMNETEIGQVVVNLLANAIEASPVSSQVRLLIEAETSRIVCSVVDQGIGMDAEAQKLAFDPFFTRRRTDGGTGLGLSMAHTIVTNHGGDIWIDKSEVNEGTTISFWLPRAKPNS